MASHVSIFRASSAVKLRKHTTDTLQICIYIILISVRFVIMSCEKIKFFVMMTLTNWDFPPDFLRVDWIDGTISQFDKWYPKIQSRQRIVLTGPAMNPRGQFGHQ